MDEFTGNVEIIIANVFEWFFSEKPGYGVGTSFVFFTSTQNSECYVNISLGKRSERRNLIQNKYVGACLYFFFLLRYRESE